MSYGYGTPRDYPAYPPLKQSGLPEDDFARIRDMVGLFIDKIWFILGVMLIAFIGAVIFFYSMPNQYEAVTRLMIKSSPKEVFLQTQEFKDLML
ncbi:MAG TPA: Wzz/FepE/Etk N-terminal domain-containing protein, partial [bacterium]|nr:Wzz/FepE/Etk N-terminal domain-containing protein [bacterium]